MLGDYDVWKFQYKYTNELQTGLRLYDTSIDSSMWNIWLEPYYYPTEEIEKGKIALQYRNNYYKGLVSAYSFFVEFEGHKTICLNAGSVSSQVFDSVEEDYDIMLVFCYEKHRKYNVSLYTKKDIDVSEIAKKYGGGGHAKAAGFRHDNVLSLLGLY